MRKVFSGIAAILLCGVWGVSQAKADVCGSVAGNIVQNCGFETGSLSSWTVGGNTGFLSIWGVDNSMPNSGSYEAYFGAAVSPVSLSQTLTSALNSEKYQVTFYLDQNSQDATGGYTHAFNVSFDGALLDSASNVAYTGGYVKYTFTATTAASGNSDVLMFNFQNDDDFFFLDDVSVTALGPASVAAPEPASFLLVVPALAGVFALVRRKRIAA